MSFKPQSRKIACMEKERSNKVVWLVLILLFLGVWLYYGKRDIYRPVYYPNKHDLTNYILGTKFSSLEDAREWVYQQNKLRGDQDWDYEIGKNPKPSKFGDIEICEETLR